MAEQEATNIMMKTLAGSFALQGALFSVRNFDGQNMPLKDFIQDLRNGKLHITEEQEKQYVAAILGRLEGSARDCTYGKEFLTIESLIKHLKKRFAPGKNYSYYTNKISNLRMRQGESVGDFYDKLNILISGATSALQEELNLTAEAVRPIIQPLEKTSLDIFIRGLPADIAKQVDSTRPDTLAKAYDEAIRIETRMDAKIIPDTRNNFYNRRTHNWEREEYSSSNNQRFQDNFNHRNYQYNNQYNNQRRYTPQYDSNYQQAHRTANMPQFNRRDYRQSNINYVQQTSNHWQPERYNNNLNNFNRNLQSIRYTTNTSRLFNPNEQFNGYQPVLQHQHNYDSSTRQSYRPQQPSTSYNQQQRFYNNRQQYRTNGFRPREILDKSKNELDNPLNLNSYGARQLTSPNQLAASTSLNRTNTSMQAQASTSTETQKPIMIINKVHMTSAKAKSLLVKDIEKMKIN